MLNAVAISVVFDLGFSNKRIKGGHSKRPWQDSNLQSPDPKSGALTIRPHGLTWWAGPFWMTTLTESMVKYLIQLRRFNLFQSVSIRFYTCSVGGEKTETGTHSSVAITQWKIKPTENMINIAHTKANNPSVRIGSMILKSWKNLEMK